MAPSSRTAPCEESGLGAGASLALDRASLKARNVSPDLLEKLDGSAYAYFRALARPYELRTCVAFRSERGHLPVIAIHGDAHLEQFVVTPATAALEDYDQSGFGPAVVDLVRYAASVHLACREVAWPLRCAPDPLVDAYFRAYREALDRPPVRTATRIAERLRRMTPTEPEPWLRWAEGLMRPLDREQEERVRRGWATFRRVDVRLHPERAGGYHDVVRVGALQMGVGSALETKLLFRLRGPTDSPSDDVIVEARSSEPPAVNACASRTLGALQPLFFMSILGPRMPDVHGFAKLGDDLEPDFWVQSWVLGYREVAIKDIADEAEMRELVEDAARQLAGHFWTRYPDQLRAVQREAQLETFDATASRAAALAKELAAETVREWEHFRRVGP